MMHFTIGLITQLKIINCTMMFHLHLVVTCINYIAVVAWLTAITINILNGL